MLKLLSRLRTLLTTRTLALVAAALLVLVLTPDWALAADTAPSGDEGFGTFLAKLFGKGGEMFAMLMVWISLGAVFLATWVASWVGDLMDSSFIFDSGLQNTIHMAWEVIRDFVNISFILLMLVLAVMVVLGLGEGKGTELLKKVLPKIVIALIAVNLTFFGARLILTTSDVLSTIIFTLPSAVPSISQEGVAIFCGAGKPPENATFKDCADLTRKDLFEEINGAKLKEELSNNIKTMSEKQEDGKAAKYKDENVKKLLGKLKEGSKVFNASDLQSFFDKKNGVYAILTYMYDSVNILQSQLPGLGAEASTESSNLFIAAFFNLATSLILCLVIVALGLAMIVRVVVLWVAIVVSPVAALAFVLKDLLQLDLGSKGVDPVGQFLTHAFLPVPIAAALSIGFIMILSGTSLVPSADIGLSSQINQAHGFAAILWWIGGVLVIWKGTFAAFKMSEYVSGLTSSVETFGQAAASGAVDLLKYAPIIPGVGHLANITEAPMAAVQRVRSAGSNRSMAAGTGILEGLDPSGKWWKEDMAKDHITSAMNAASKSDKPEEIFGHIKGMTEQARNSANGLEMLQKTKLDHNSVTSYKKLGIKDASTTDTHESILARIHEAEHLNAEQKGQLKNLHAAIKSGGKVAEAKPAPVKKTRFAHAGTDWVEGEIAGLKSNASTNTRIIVHKDHRNDAKQAWVVDTTDGKDEAVGTVEEVKAQITQELNLLNNRNGYDDVGEYIAKKLNELTKLRAGLSDTDRAKIKQEIENLKRNTKLQDGHKDDVQAAYKKLFNEEVIFPPSAPSTQSSAPSTTP